MLRRVSAKGKRTVFAYSKYIDLLIFLATVIVNTILSLIFLRSGRQYNSTMYAYINPIVVVGALYLLLFFSKLEIGYNRIINWFGASSFAVYLLHSQVDIRKLFTKVIVKLDFAYEGLCEVGLIFCFLVFVYIVSVLVDQLRIWLWNLVWSRKGKKYEVCTGH